MTTYKLDLHSHPPKTTDLVKNLFKKQGNLVIGITNWNNSTKYKKFLEATNKLPKTYKINLKHKEYFISITKNKKTIHFIKSDELETKNGHILIVGHKGKIITTNFKKTLKDCHKQGDIIIADHPLHHENIAHFFILRLMGNKHKLSLGKKTIEKNKKYIDALELNSYFSKDWKKIKKFAKKNNLNVIANSDAHFTNELFKSYIELKNLNFKNPKLLKKSIRKALKKKIKIHAHRHGFSAGYKHVLSGIFKI